METLLNPALVRIGIDIAIIVMVVEAAILILYRARTGRGLGYRDTLLIALAGLGLIVALRAAVTGGSLALVGVFLALGGIIHGIDLTLRIRKALGEGK